MQQINNLERLAGLITETNQYFLHQVQKQVNTALTLRNWLIGYHIFQYEQQGEDRAQYGEQLFKKLAQQLKDAKIKGLSFTNLYLCRQFYLAYPQILQSAAEYLQPSQNQLNIILQSPTEKSAGLPQTPGKLLLEKLSFTHFVELVKCEEPLKRLFYETQALKNQWSVRELQRTMNSMLYERTGLSSDKKAIVKSYKVGSESQIDDVLRSPYVLEFLGLEEKPSYSEGDLEQAIINHLQIFLLEMGRGFCFEARQKRITFDNTHYRIDLVFYHRVLKCHVLIDLKLGEFSHADAGQMNVYLNYYKENEMEKGDNPPVGIILCAGKNEALVKYATTGLPQKVFVSKYLINLPSEKELEKIILEEQQKSVRF
ncbi:PDDEXK nuclease domain-containing protein [Chitinophagaceae bacterium LB-8]|uniref:PDDEXK nuclease domain-containing protein n=1 Tax=Paraflavisolibacter caeni TaxID=2982496 RepID=A0A9X2XWD5_9BACT|nr:PDDEXK nuclease domain-containing protein [Paraflavisolibacter caeni]MCU7549867.1 PDDEXK nuclease domain-containing protein [Paraflavisolibacter caeni]